MRNRKYARKLDRASAEKARNPEIAYAIRFKTDPAFRRREKRLHRDVGCVSRGTVHQVPNLAVFVHAEGVLEVSV